MVNVKGKVAVHLENIKRSLQQFGWELVETRVIRNFWIAEIWLVESSWTPAGLKVYLTFEIDGQADARDASAVWAAKASLSRPDDWFIENGVLIGEINDGTAAPATLPISKEKDIQPFFEGLAKLRGSAV